MFYLRSTYPTVTSNMLDPTDEETAISPNPFLATITLVIKSGIEVPAAKKVKPITWNKFNQGDIQSAKIELS